MYPAGLTCRVGGRPDGGKDPTWPLWRNIGIIIIIIIILLLLLLLLLLLCVVMLLHNGQVGSLPPSGRPPTRQVSPAGYMFLCSPHGDQ